MGELHCVVLLWESLSFVCFFVSCFFNFWHYHPHILQHFNEIFFTLVSLVFLKYLVVPISPLWSALQSLYFIIL